MKKPSYRRVLKTLVLAMGLLTATYRAAAGPGAINLITIDWSNPFAVIFTGTGTFPLTSDSTTFSSNGVTLANFFTTSVSSGQQAISGTQPATGVGRH